MLTFEGLDGDRAIQEVPAKFFYFRRHDLAGGLPLDEHWQRFNELFNLRGLVFEATRRKNKLQTDGIGKQSSRGQPSRATCFLAQTDKRLFDRVETKQRRQTVNSFQIAVGRDFANISA